MTYHIPIPPEQSGMELDEFLCLSFPLFDKGFLRSQVREGRVLVDGNAAQPSQRLRQDQVLFVDLDEERAVPAPPPPRTELVVLYEDEGLLAVDKPAGLASEPERWDRDGACLSTALLGHALERSDERDAEPGALPLEFRPRLAHRLDKDTTGVVLVAKDLETERALRRAFEERRVEKTYLALVEGEYPPPEDGEWDTIDLPIAPDEKRSGRMRVVDGEPSARGGKARARRAAGKPARTLVALERRYRGFTLLRCRPETGRTHQIRVHLREVGHPLVVDPLYGRRDSLRLSEFKPDYRPKRGRAEAPLVERLTLHAWRIRVPGDVLGRAADVEVEAPVPKDLQRVLKQLAKVRPFGRRP